MSILIKGMDMPKCCCDCLLYDSAGFCASDPTREFEDYNHKRPDDCPLSEMPTPHGDLIDRDYLLNHSKVLFNDTVINQQTVINAPAVIKKEE